MGYEIIVNGYRLEFSNVEDAREFVGLSRHRLVESCENPEWSEERARTLFDLLTPKARALVSTALQSTNALDVWGVAAHFSTTPSGVGAILGNVRRAALRLGMTAPVYLERQLQSTVNVIVVVPEFAEAMQKIDLPSMNPVLPANGP